MKKPAMIIILCAVIFLIFAKAKITPINPTIYNANAKYSNLAFNSSTSKPKPARSSPVASGKRRIALTVTAGSGSMGAVMTYLAQSCGNSGIDSTYCPIAAQWIDDNIATCINKNVNISSGGPNYQASVMGVNNLYTAIFTNYTAMYIVLLRRVYDNYYGTYIGQ